MDWKQQAWLWFTRAAQFWLMQTMVVYLSACIVASKPVSPKEYVAFTYHIIQWRPGASWLGKPGLYARDMR